MSNERPKLVFKRIMVALDASPSSMEALEAAAEMAARFQAELHGLFIEDINLLRLATLSFSQEVGHFSGVRRLLESTDVERQLRVQERRIQRVFQEIAERRRVRATFRIIRGSLVRELLAAATGADILLMHGASWGVGSQRLCPEIRHILSQATTPVMLVRRSRCVMPPVMVVYDGSDAAQGALLTGATMAEQEGGPLIVLLADEVERSRLRAQVSDLLRNEPHPVMYRLLTPSGTERLISRVRRAGCGTLVLPASSELIQDEDLLRLIEEVDVSVLLVR